MSEWKKLETIEDLIWTINSNLTIRWVHSDVEFKPIEAKKLLTTASSLETVINKWNNFDSRIEVLQESKAPTHEEITDGRYWLIEESFWLRCLGYDSNARNRYYFTMPYRSELIYFDRDYFIGRESTDTPPESV